MSGTSRGLVKDWLDQGKDPVHFKMPNKLSELKKPFCAYLTEAILNITTEESLAAMRKGSVGVAR